MMHLLTEPIGLTHYLVVSTILLVGALTFVPSLALGPVVEQLQMLAGK